MECPNCGKESISTHPKEIMICECGYNFQKKVVEIPQESESVRQEVVIKDIEMSFGAMIRFMVKWAIASIPAAIIITIIMMILMSVFTKLFQK